MAREGGRRREGEPASLQRPHETKAEVEIPSPKNGKIVKLMAKEGEKVHVHAGLVTIEIEGAAAPAEQKPATPKASSSKEEPKEAAPAESEATPEETTQPIPVTAAQPKAAPAPAPAKPAAPAATVSATPAVRKLAADMKVDLSKISGTGPGGRITEDDVRGLSQAPSPTRLGATAGSAGGRRCRWFR